MRSATGEGDPWRHFAALERPSVGQNSSCRTLTLGAPRNLTPVRFCLFYHYVKKESRLFSGSRQGLASEPGKGHAPGPPRPGVGGSSSPEPWWDDRGPGAPWRASSEGGGAEPGLEPS